MSEKEAVDTQREALREVTDPERPLRHEGALRRYLAGMAYVESHPHRSTEPAGSERAERSRRPD
jgi:hypothetical protein